MNSDVKKYIENNSINPLFLVGDSFEVLRSIPDNTIDCCITSPPYWNKRQYANGGIGLEKDYRKYISSLIAIFMEVYRILKPTGSFWLNIGDSYKNKNLLNIPWRVAIELTDNGWILRNTIIWNKVKGGLDNSTDKLRNTYEPLFHFVKQSKGYYYDIDCIRNSPKSTKVVNGAVVSATGVSGVRYKRKIELSTELTEEQKANAYAELEKILKQVQSGEVSDFRMVIRGAQRTTHSDSEKVSGRAKELHEKGFYFLKYNSKGSKPGDIWDIIPEDTQGRKVHFAPYPEDLCKTPIILTCPPSGIVLDPFVGTGTSCFVAKQFRRKSIGIDIANEYIDIARKRCGCLGNEQSSLPVTED
ncbi:DNA-methyltransferase [Butyricicoccus sp.]|uniref:DNA-methyltransferase n=1 Tax=Butyricicoccus sp. TaxID=2049021 RepID=UPI003D7C7B8B